MFQSNIKTLLLTGTALLSVLVGTSVSATEVEDWAGLAAAKDDAEITFANDIVATGTPSKINLTSSEAQIVDGGYRSLTGASGYQIGKTSGTDLTIRNFGSVTDGKKEDYTYSYTDTEGNTVYKKITSSINSFNKTLFTSSTLANLSVSDTVFDDNSGTVMNVNLKTTTDEASLTNLVFHGNNCPNSDNSILTISKGIVSIDGLVFDSNNAQKWAIGVDFLGGSQTTINNAIVQNNRNSYFGPFQLSGGHVEIDNSQFVNNQTLYDGGAITVTSTMHNISNTLFKGNTALYGDGGAIWYSQFASSPVFTNTTFEGNESAGYGGALYMCGTGVSTGTFWLENSSLSNNQADVLGGALYTEGLEALHITNSEFTENQSQWGGGIYVKKEPASIVDTNFTNNQAIEGGGVYAENADVAIIAAKRDVEFSGNTASNDSDDYNGGADIYFQADKKEATLSLNAAADKKIIFNGSIASYYGENPIAAIEVNKTGVTYSTNDGETETVHDAGTAGEIQFNGKVGDADNIFNVNVYGGTLSFGAAPLCANLDAQGGTINIANSAATALTANFAADSTLALKVNSATDYGSLTADTITIEEGAKLKATLADGIVSGGETVTLQLLSAGNTDFNNFEDTFDNNLYHFEKVGKDGLYSISSNGNTPSDVVVDAGASAWVVQATKGYLESGAFDAGTVPANIASKFSDLAQNDAKALIEEIKALAPTEAAVVQDKTMIDSSRLFKTVDSYLRGQEDPMGVSGGDEDSGVSIWMKSYMGKAKVDENNRILEQKTKNIGVMAAIEKALTSEFKVGLGLHYDVGDIDMFRRKIDTDTIVGFMYGEYKLSDWFVNAIASYGQSDYDERKYVLGSKYSASYDVSTTSVGAITGYQFKNFIPEIGLRYYHMDRDGYKDTALQYVSSSKIDMLRAVTGARFVANYGMFTPNMYVGVNYDVVAPKDDTVVNLANGASYTVVGKRLPRLECELDVGVNAHINENMTVGISYMGAYRRHYQEHTGMVGLRYDF